MTPAQFLDHVRARFDAPWLADAVDEVDRVMEGDGGHDFGHLYRVFCNALHIVEADEADADMPAIVAAVVFHDIVNLPKNHPERHTASALSADHASRFLADHDLNLEIVAEAIRCHSWSAGLTPVSYEARVVADADNLEAVGAFGIARTFYVSGRMGGSIVNMADPHGEERELDDRSFAIDHFHKKLLKLREHMHTTAGRALADQRHQVMVDFLAQLDSEIAI